MEMLINNKPYISKDKTFRIYRHLQNCRFTPISLELTAFDQRL